MEPKDDGPWLGVLGGMGPMAGAVFMERLVALTDAGRDQDHIPAVLWSDPRVPDRSAAALGRGDDPLPRMLAAMRGLERAGVALVAVPCNSANVWFDQLSAASTVPVLDIIDSTCDDLARHGVTTGRIGVLGTAGTLELGIYQRPLQARGYDVVVPTDDEITNLSTVAIDLVKANRIAESFEPAAESIRRLIGRGADAVMLGCTELPLAVPHGRRADFDVVLTDSIDALARTVIDRWQVRS
jgi:aspartate racemase